MDDYAFFCYVDDLPELLAATNTLETRMRESGNIIGADRVLKAYAVLRDGLIKMGEKMAAKTTEILREKEQSTRVRPDSLGAGGPRLGDYLHGDALPILWGSVGVANETELDAEVPWWYTNEEGSAGRVGGQLFGVFQPGEALASGAESRVHPIFEPWSGQGPASASTIVNPIPARRFIEHSIPEIVELWRLDFELLKNVFMDEVTAAQTMAP
jgi:hypothetical protein